MRRTNYYKEPVQHMLTHAEAEAAGNERTAVESRESSLINRAEVRRKLIQEARDNRYHWKLFEPRVSEATLAKIERATLDAVRNHIWQLQAKGKTI
jgi:hypothetical protein